MKEKITVITPTGDRPEAFALCSLWMAAQTLRPYQWLIVDDGQKPLNCDDLPDYAEYIRREPAAVPVVTLLDNLAAAWPKIEGEKILFWEDDDYYAPTYIETMAMALNVRRLAGVGCSRYYHVPSGRYYRFADVRNVSLAQTGMSRSLLDYAAEKLSGNYMFDLRLWRGLPPDQVFAFKDDAGILSVGIKGMPGRAGIGIGHRNYQRWSADTPDRKVLRQWLADDFEYYQPWFDRKDGEDRAWAWERPQALGTTPAAPSGLAT